MIKTQLVSALRLYKIQIYGEFKSKKKLHRLLKVDLEKLFKFQLLTDSSLGQTLDSDTLRIIYGYLDVYT